MKPHGVACRGPTCQGSVLWAVGEAGSRIPLDARAPVYRVIGHEPDGTPRVRRVPDAYVSHFATCRDASTFSASKRAT